jgi:hypothetical protein
VSAFTTVEYVEVLSHLFARKNEGYERRLLQLQYASSDRTTSAATLARQIDRTGDKVNLLYGGLGGKIWKYYGRTPPLDERGEPELWRALSSGFEDKYDRSTHVWRMHPELAQALEELGVVATRP